MGREQISAICRNEGPFVCVLALLTVFPASEAVRGALFRSGRSLLKPQREPVYSLPVAAPYIYEFQESIPFVQYRPNKHFDSEQEFRELQSE
ncbi:hypothetical protein Tcan_02911 [Toxocara canis]|uniref:Uncharacterized protein n=1 Tax=Toxocara canis TaxID=6265 RepID=A0A0B2V0P0_TOXCA|nr:hypothetical protein Tcan_02911 [Toxocara canis]